MLQRRSRRSPVVLRLAILSDPSALAELRSATDRPVAMRRRLHYLELEDYLAFASQLDDAETTQFAHDLAALEERLLTEARTSDAEELPETCRSSSDLEELAERVNDRAAHHYRIRRVRCDAEVGDCELFYTRICRSPGRAGARVRRGRFRVDACTPANPRSGRAVLRLLHRQEARLDDC